MCCYQKWNEENWFIRLYQHPRMLLDRHTCAYSVASKIGRTLGIYHTYMVNNRYATSCVVLSYEGHLSCSCTAHTTTPCFHASPNAL